MRKIQKSVHFSENPPILHYYNFKSNAQAHVSSDWPEILYITFLGPKEKNEGLGAQIRTLRCHHGQSSNH